MTEFEKLQALKAMTDETDEGVLSTYLGIAGNKILRRAYPYDSSKTEVPVQYTYTQLEIACYLLNKRGAEGETSHNENGINRTYGSADVPAALLREIVPVASLVGGAHESTESE